MQCKAGRELKIKIPTINNGSEDWPPQTKLFLIDYSKVSPFPDGKISIDVGYITSNANSSESFDIVAPTITGLYEFKFSYGIEGEGLFGEKFTV